MTMRKTSVIMLVLASMLGGCSAVGPPSVQHDRFDYNEALSDSWKEQTLLNIVRLRYADMPIFLEVASIVSGYTLEGTVSVGGGVTSEDALQGDFLDLRTGGTFTDRPTITYAPVTGEKFHRSFMTPIPPKLLLFLMESGWSPEIVLPLTVDAINGLRGRKAAGKRSRVGNQRFYKVIRLLSEVQESGSIALRIVREAPDKETIIIFFFSDDISPEVATSRAEIWKLLDLKSDDNEITVTYGLMPEAEDEIALQTRSMLQMMITLATLVDVPQEHVEKGYTMAIEYDPGEEEKKLDRLIRINSGLEQPENAFASVRYKDYWFWIDEHDFLSKRTFTFLMILFSITESEESNALPLVTIPAG
jgi:hypothetical protein